MITIDRPCPDDVAPYPCPEHGPDSFGAGGSPCATPDGGRRCWPCAIAWRLQPREEINLSRQRDWPFRKWTADELRNLMESRERNMTYRDIGLALNRTASSVADRFYKLQRDGRSPV